MPKNWQPKSCDQLIIKQTKDTATIKENLGHPSNCPKGFICPDTEVPEKDGKFCKHYKPVTKACVKSKVVSIK